MKYIVLDLEWNRPENVTEIDNPGLVFEIIEIGAVKLDQSGRIEDGFSELVNPQVYRTLNAVTGQLVHLDMEELKKGSPFREVMQRFLEWCGKEEFMFCTWGNADLTELQRNMEYYGMEPLSHGPIRFYDIQKIYAYIYEEDKKAKRTLEYAVDFLGIEKEDSFHRAYGDACYTGKVLNRMLKDETGQFVYVSYDVHHPPVSRKSEIKIQFPTYFKYISRSFQEKAEVMKDREVASTRCYLCHHNVKKKVRWFTVNHKNYFCVAHCDKHGYLKGKIRILKTDDELFFAVKTTKLIPEEGVEQILRKRKKALEMHKKQKKKTF